MELPKIKYNPSISGYLFKVYLFCIAISPAIVILFFDKYDTIAHNAGEFINNYFNAFLAGAVLLSPALLFTLFVGFGIYQRFKDEIVFKGILIAVFIFLSILSFKMVHFIFFDSIVRSTSYQMTFVFLFIVASFAYKLQLKQN